MIDAIREGWDAEAGWKPGPSLIGLVDIAPRDAIADLFVDDTQDLSARVDQLGRQLARGARRTSNFGQQNWFHALGWNLLLIGNLRHSFAIFPISALVFTAISFAADQNALTDKLPDNAREAVTKIDELAGDLRRSVSDTPYIPALIGLGLLLTPKAYGLIPAIAFGVSGGIVAGHFLGNRTEKPLF